MEVLVTTAESGDYDAGDIIDARPDGFPWGSQEKPPKFRIFRVPELALSGRGLDARALLKPGLFRCLACGKLLVPGSQGPHVLVAHPEVIDPSEVLELRKRRLYRLDLNTFALCSKEFAADALSYSSVQEPVTGTEV